MQAFLISSNFFCIGTKFSTENELKMIKGGKNFFLNSKNFQNFDFSNLMDLKHPMVRVFHSENIFSKIDIFNKILHFYVANGRF